MELYCKQIWNDQKTVNVIVEACFSPVTKIRVTAMQFFLGKAEQVDNDDEDEESNVPDLREVQGAVRVSKKTKKNAKKLKKVTAMVTKKMNAKDKERKVAGFAALQLVNDAQGFAEKLFRELKTSNERFEV